ncbi:phosphatidylethanolamine-binding protein [Phlyctochytrium arcticum]|nr:phosphatidylethanolamine-binding protein [Phlyctochytrium arcticum]
MENKVHKALLADEVIPDVLPDFRPAGVLDISYQSKEVDLGLELTPEETQAEPSKVEFVAASDDVLKSSKFFTLVLADPDAFSRENHIKRNYRHWVVVDIPAGGSDNAADVSLGQTITPYMGPAPPEKTRLHRYVFIWYAQDKELANTDAIKKLMANEDRGCWNVADFATENAIKPLAATYFVAQNPKQ